MTATGPRPSNETEKPDRVSHQAEDCGPRQEFACPAAQRTEVGVDRGRTGGAPASAGRPRAGLARLGGLGK
jgi:hypothetical protein